MENKITFVLSFSFSTLCNICLFVEQLFLGGNFLYFDEILMKI